jgi:hypothetical protein
MLPKDMLHKYVSNNGAMHQSVGMEVRYGLAVRAHLRIMQVRP